MKKRQTKQAFLVGLLAALMCFSQVSCTTASNTSQSGNDAPPAADTGSANGEAKEIRDIVVGMSIGATTEERRNREIEMFRAYAADKGFELLVQDAGNHTTKQVSQCKSLLAQGVVCSNDGIAGGAIQALAAQGLTGSVPIAGQDANLAACQCTVEGAQYGTVYKPLAPLNQAAYELDAAITTGADEKSGVDFPDYLQQ